MTIVAAPRRRAIAQVRRGLAIEGKMRGFNVPPTIAQTSTNGGVDARRRMFAEWNWETEIRPRTLLGQTLGCNALRVIGQVDGILDGSYTRAVYEARLTQWITLLDSIGMLFYPSAVAFPEISRLVNGTSPFTWAQLQDEIAHHAGFLDTFGPKVIALDICSELDIATDGPDRAARMAAIVDACHAAAPLLPLTISTVLPGPHYSGPLANVDFYDRHVYTEVFKPNFPIGNAQTGIYGQNPGTKPFVIGEFGAPFKDPSWTPAQRRQYAALIRDEFHADPRSRGSLAWATNDQVAESPNANGVGAVDNITFGMFNTDLTPRTNDIASVLATFPKTV